MYTTKNRQKYGTSAIGTVKSFAQIGQQPWQREINRLWNPA
jgi:hypothetical protein